MDPIQSMPNMVELTQKNFTPKEWLTYYKNIWTRNNVARTIDVMTDMVLKAEDPNQIVNSDDGRSIMVKERLEHRKMLVSDGMKLIAAIDKLLESEDITKEMWNETFLAVAPDMLPEEAKAEVDPAADKPAEEKTEPAEAKTEEKPEEASAEAQI